MKKYYVVQEDDTSVEIPREVVGDIITEYLTKTFYWSIGLSCFIIGFLLGVIA